MAQVWDGTTLSRTLTDHYVAMRTRLADVARAYDWTAVLAVLEEEPRLVNSTRPDGTSWYAPLHQAAHGGAPVEVVERLVALGAWRSLRTASGDQPADIARRRRLTHVLGILYPRWKTAVPPKLLAEIQAHFHAVIRERVGKLVEEHRLRLPELEVLQELDDPKLWFAVPGMYGGFSYRLAADGADTRLVSESWSRVVGGSGQRHVIDANGARLTGEGFV